MSHLARTPTEDPLDPAAGFLGLGRSLTFPYPQWRARDRYRTVFFDEGDGPPMVLVHGLGGNATHWELLLEELVRGHRVVGLDLVGCGWSAKPRLRYTPELLTDHLLDFLERRGVGRAVMLGHSLGAAVVTELALRRPELVAGLVLLAPVGLTPVPRWLRLASPLVLHRRLLFPLFRHHARAVLRSNFMASEQQSARVRWFLDSSARDAPGGPNVRDFARVTETLCPALLRHDLWGRLPRLLAPVLAMAGEGDRLTAPALDRMDGIPRLTRVLIQRCGHMPMVERPSHVMRELRPFLASRETPGPG